MEKKIVRQLGLFIIVSLMVGAGEGCTNADNPVAPNSGVSVQLSASFSKTTGSNALGKGFGMMGADSLRIDSAVVVFQRIKFESHIDTVTVDSTGSGKDDDDREINITFKGPFVVHVRDTTRIDFADKVLPAGTYDGIKFKIHRLKKGEHHEDSDKRNNRSVKGSDSSYVESSIVVWGAVKKNNLWVPFTFKFDGELEFKLKGNFTVSEATSTVNIALNFNMALWFKNPETGALLDPTDTSSKTRELFKRAIKHSFGKGKGGRDRNGDGHPDD